MSIIEMKNRGHFFPLIRTSTKTGADADRKFDRLSTRITDFLHRSGQNLESESKFKNYFSNFKKRDSVQSITSNSISLFSSTESLASLSQNDFELDENGNGNQNFGNQNFDNGNQNNPMETTTPTESIRSTCSKLETKFQNFENEENSLLVEINQKINCCVPSTPEPGSMSIFSMKDLMQRKSQLEMESVKRRIQARETFFSDKILLLRKTLEKQCSEASQIAEEQRQLASKLQQEMRSLTLELNQVQSNFQNEKMKNGLLDEKFQKASEELSKCEAALSIRNSVIEQLKNEKVEISQQTELLRKELHRLKLDVHMKANKLDSMEAEMADGRVQHAAEIEQLKSNFQSKLEKLELEQSLLSEELEEEQKAKKRLEENVAELRRKQKQEFERHQEELREAEESNQMKLKKLEFQLSEVEKEKTEILGLKRELEMKLVEAEVMMNLNSEKTSDDVKVERIQKLESECSALQLLLKDAQAVAETFRKRDSENKAIIRQLKTSFEVGESEKSQLRRAHAKTEEDLQDTLNQLQDVTRREAETASFNRKLGQESVKLMSSLEETKLEMENILKNYNSSLVELAAEKSNLADQLTFNKALAHDNDVLTEQVAQLNKKIQILEETKAERENTAKKEYYLRLGQFKSKIKMDEIQLRRYETTQEKLKSDLNLAVQEISRLSLEKKTANRLLQVAEKQGREAAQQRKNFCYKLDEANAKNAKTEKLYEISIKEANALRDELRTTKERLEKIKEAAVSLKTEDQEIYV